MTQKKDDFNLKSKEDEKQMIEFTNVLQENMKKVLPNLKRVVDMLELYSDAEIALNQATAKLITAIDGISETGMGDFNKGITVVREILCELYNGRQTSNNQGTLILVDSLKKEYLAKTKDVQQLASETSKERKKFDQDLSNAEKKTATSTDFKTSMEEYKRIEKERQKALMGHLQLTVMTNRATFGSVIGSFAVFFQSIGSSLKSSGDKFISHEPWLNKLSKSKSNIPRELRDLMTNKKQSYVNLSGISPELKQILKSAGLRPSHLANKETVTQLYLKMKPLVDQGRLPADLLDQLKTTGNVDESAIRQSPTISKPPATQKGWVSARVPGKPSSKPSQPPQPSKSPQSTPSVPKTSLSQSTPKASWGQQPSKSNAPPPPPHSLNTPPPPAPRGGQNVPPPPPPPQSLNTPPPPPVPRGGFNTPPPPPPPSQSLNIPPPPPAPRGGSNVPPPPPPPSQSFNAPPPPPMNAPPTNLSSSKTSAPSLLDQIRGGASLKKSTERTVEPVKEELTAEQKGDLTSLLCGVMANRRKDIADDDYEDEDDSEDWED